MDVQITVRRGEAGETFIRRARERAARLARFEPRLARIELLLDEDAGRTSAEARASVPGVPTLVARAGSENRRTAVDQALRKLGRQLRKERSKRVEHRAPPMATLMA